MSITGYRLRPWVLGPDDVPAITDPKRPPPVRTARGFNAPDDIRAQITTCTDLAQLETWLTRAATAQTLQDLFAENESD